MAALHKLSKTKLNSRLKTGRHSDGGGLFLKVTPSGTRSWLFRYTNKITHKQVEMGLGAFPQVSADKARELAADYRGLVDEGKDARIARDTATITAGEVQVWTFDKCAKEYITAKSAGWDNAKTLKSWVSTIEKYASPVIGHIPVADIGVPEVMKVINPIWESKTSTAGRLRGRIERILTWAEVMGYRSGKNPALWRGNLKELLAAPSDISKPNQHHAALPYSELPVIMGQLNKIKTMPAAALQFLILTGCRTGEIRFANWSEIDLMNNIWTIPAKRMKSSRDHRVPLPDQAQALLNNLPRVNGWLFPSNQANKPIGSIAMWKLLNVDLKRDDITVHGFRSTFRDWVAEETHHNERLAEAALAHMLSDATEAAYQRGDKLKKRAVLMQDWADYAYSDTGNLVAFG